MGGRKDISGQVINKWRVIDYSHTNNKIAYYNCICLNCGKDFKVDGRNIRSGRSKCCVECARPRTAAANKGKARSKYDPQTAAFRGLFSRYKKDAKKRNYSFLLQFEEFRKITTSNCHYCGIKPSQRVNPLKSSGRSAKREAEGWIIYNGVDRVNSTMGYITKNVVPCCETCNKAKLTMSVDEFKTWIKRIHGNINNF